MNIGDKIIIDFNPHHIKANQILGTVKGINLQAGVGGCDLIDVEYDNPEDGKTYTYPIGRHNLRESGSAEEFLKMAERFQALALHCKAMAAKLSGI